MSLSDPNVTLTRQAFAQGVFDHDREAILAVDLHSLRIAEAGTDRPEGAYFEVCPCLTPW